MRIVHVNLVRPRGRPDPDAVLARWPTLGAVAESVAGAGGTVTVVQAFHRDAVLERHGVRYRFVAEPAFPGRATGLAPWRVARAVQAAQPQAIHVNGLDFPLHTRWLCRLGMPVLVQDHASAPGLRGRRWGLRHVSGAAFTHAGQADAFMRAGELASNLPVFAIPESSSAFTPGSQVEARAQTGMWGDPAVLWVGRLDANKDPLTVLDAVARAAAELPGIMLWCCFHDAPLLETVQRVIANRPVLAQRVRLVGHVPHRAVETWMRAADLFVSASRREGSGYALIEALACGTWPVLSAIPPFQALTGEGTVGTLAAAGNSTAMAEALVAWQRLDQAAARLRVTQHFARHLSFASIGTRLLATYAALAERRA